MIYSLSYQRCQEIQWGQQPTAGKWLATDVILMSTTLQTVRKSLYFQNSPLEFNYTRDDLRLEPKNGGLVQMIFRISIG